MLKRITKKHMNCVTCFKALPKGVEIGVNREYIPSWEELTGKHIECDV